jgi:hypothetical protein
MPRMRTITIRWGIGLTLMLGLPAALAGATGATGANEPARAVLDLVRIDGHRALYPPTQAAWSPASGFVALATDGETRRLTLYRGGPDGRRWQRWIELPASAGAVEPQLTIAGDRALVAGAENTRIWTIAVPLSPQTARKSLRASDLALDTLDAGAPILALALDGSLPDTTGEVFAHLAYLAEPESMTVALNRIALASQPERLRLTVPNAPRATPADSAAATVADSAALADSAAVEATPETTRFVAYLRSSDAGLTWAPPETLAVGDLDRPGLFAHVAGRRTVDLCYRRGEFMAWRGSGSQGRSWIREKAIRMRAASGSRNAVARNLDEVFLICESDTHQVTGATSLNQGYNWERAIAVARDSRNVRVPALDSGGGLFWVAYSASDSVVVLRSTEHTLYPKQWNRGINIAAGCTAGPPDVVALPDSTAGLIYATPAGEVYFARVRQPAK